MDHTGTPAFLWLEALKYTCYLLNHTLCLSLDAIPLQLLIGSTVDNSALLQYHWYQRVYCTEDDYSFPLESKEISGCFVGFSENVGHRLTYKILTDHTHKIIHRSRVFSAEDPKSINLCADKWGAGDIPHEFISTQIDDQSNVDRKFNADNEKPHTLLWIRTGPNTKVYYTTKKGGPNWKDVCRRITIDTSNDQVIEDIKITNNTDSKLLHRPLPKNVTETKTILYYQDPNEPYEFISTRIDDSPALDDKINANRSMPSIDIEDLIGKSFRIVDEHGNNDSINIVNIIEKQQNKVEEDPKHVQFKVQCNSSEYEDIMAYNELMDIIETNGETNILWEFKRIKGHQGPLSQKHPDYKGSTYKVTIEWENREITDELLSIIAIDTPISCAKYAKKNNLLGLPGWKRLNPIAKKMNKMIESANKVKIRSVAYKPKYKYGVEIPCSYLEAIKFDKENGNIRWQDATELEMEHMRGYKVFKDIGKFSSIPDGFKNIPVHMVYDVKHDSRHRARLVANGQLTDIPIDSVYSSVVSLRGFRMLLFLDELNGLPIWTNDIASAYLEAHTNERVCILAGPEFGELENHRLVIDKALYRLRTSGQRWHDRFSKCLLNEGFKPCLAEPDLWLRQNGNIYEYIAVYVDDLAFAMKDPQVFIDTLENKYKFKVKGTGPLEYHLGANFERDEQGTLCMTPKKYIDRMIDNYTRMFGKRPPTNVSSPLDHGDHPKLDDSELLDE